MCTSDFFSCFCLCLPTSVLNVGSNYGEMQSIFDSVITAANAEESEYERYYKNLKMEHPSDILVALS